MLDDVLLNMPHSEGSTTLTLGVRCRVAGNTSALAQEFASKPFIHLKMFPLTLILSQLDQVELKLLSSRKLDEVGRYRDGRNGRGKE